MGGLEGSIKNNPELTRIVNLVDKDSKTISKTVFLIFKKSSRSMQKKKIEFLDMKTTVWEMKYLLDRINGRLDITEEKISELGIKTETIKNETQ